MVYFIYIIVVVSFLDTFSQIPIISPYAQTLGASSFIIGLVVGMYSFTNMLGNLLAGRGMDKLGRKKLMIIGLCIAGGTLMMYSHVQSAEQLLLVRFIHGIGGGVLVPAAFAYLGDFTRRDNRGSTMALSGAAIGIAAILGPALGGIITARYEINVLFYMIGTLLLVTAIAVLLFLPDKYVKETETQSVQHIKILMLLKQPRLMNAYLGAFALMFTLGIVTYKLPLKVEEMGYSSSLTGLLLSCYGVVAIILFILPINRLSDRIGRIHPMIYGLFLISCSVLMLSLVSYVPLMFVAMMFYGTGFGLLFPAMTALVIDQTNKEERGRAFGLFYAFFSLGVVLGPFVLGILNVSHDTGLFIGFVLLSAFILILIKRRKWHRQSI